mmetsp:Transcript_101128/g.286590  ORF Transcript_101128/g.286590 Transcript_101128/m.286590 type:complete len:281 (-) Transcript_101128:2083-2925(-)
MPQPQSTRHRSLRMASVALGFEFSMVYTNWSKSMLPFVLTASSSRRISSARLSAWSFPSSAPSSSLTILSISSKVMWPLLSLSNALKASHRTGNEVERFWSMDAEINSWTLRVPELSRSIFAKSPSSARSPSLRFRCFLSPLIISSTVRTPSPFLSRHRKACSTVSAVFPSLGSCSAMTRSTKRLSSHSLTFACRLLSSWTMRVRGNVVLATLTQGCFRMCPAEIRIPGFTRSIDSTTSRAGGDSLLHMDSWNLTSLAPTWPRRSARLSALNGVVPESMW